MIAVALPELREDFGIGHGELGWIISAYLIAMAVAQPIGGRLSDQLGRSRVFRAGLLAFLAFSLAATFAPTKAIWSRDNRSAGFRLCGESSKAIRIECRIGGADLNPYLAYSALLAAGIEGIRQKMPLEEGHVGDAYQGAALREIPKTLSEATAELRGSEMLRSALGDAVVDHYVRTAEWEQSEHDREVTDREVRRGFEQY